LSDLLTKDDEYAPSESNFRQQNVSGTIHTDTLEWTFALQNFQNNGSLSGGFLSHRDTHYWLKTTSKGLNRHGVVIATREGEYLASLSYNSSSAQMRMRKNIDPHTANAIAALYAVLMSTKNVE
jgi:hypothetical protein